MFIFDSKITFYANPRQRVRMSLDRNLSGVFTALRLRIGNLRLADRARESWFASRLSLWIAQTV